MEDAYKSHAQMRREAHDRREADQRANYIAASVQRPAKMGKVLFPGDTGLPDRVRVAVALQRDEGRHSGKATMDQAAIHESGHFVTAEVCDLVATSATIQCSPFGRGDWGGAAGALERPLFDRGRWGFTADDVLHEAVFTNAGPFAERALAAGDVYAGLGEILEGCILAAKWADMLGEDRAAALHRMWTFTAYLVFDFQHEIEQTAQRLKSKRTIYRSDRKVTKILNSVRRLDNNRINPLNYTQVTDVRKIITDAPMDLVRFTEEVGQ